MANKLANKLSKKLSSPTLRALSKINLRALCFSLLFFIFNNFAVAQTVVKPEPPATKPEGDSTKVVRPVSKVDPGTGGKKEENSDFEKKEQSWDASDEKSLLKSIDYPELQVVPRASERLQMEVQNERDSIVGPYWPVQLSSVFLMVSATMSTGKYKQETPTDAQKAQNQLASQTGTLLGALWIGSTIYLEKTSAYSKGMNEVRKYNGKDKKTSLLRERVAEEALERPAKLAKTVNRLAAWTNLISAIYIAGNTAPSTPDYSGMAIGLAFMPFIFDNRFEESWEKHQEYKRKIYAPLATIDFTQDPNSKKLNPLMALRWEF